MAYCANSELKAFISCLTVNGSRQWVLSLKCVTTRNIVAHCSSVVHTDTSYDEQPLLAQLIHIFLCTQEPVCFASQVGYKLPGSEHFYDSCTMLCMRLGTRFSPNIFVE